MGKTIIVMRHGKAKRPADGQQDLERELTEAGRRSLAATLGESLALWPEDGSTEIWTSPAVRARQTAELLDRTLRRRNIPVSGQVQVVEELWAGSLDALLAHALESPADTIALVGHNPHAESLVQTLTGSEIDFATGALAALRPDTASVSGRTTNARLLWFVQGPESQRWKTLVAMEKVLADAAVSIERRYDAFLAHPDDIETMHAFRVSIRTARSLLAFARPWQNSKQNAQTQEDLKAIVRLTSRQRELDVVWSQVAEDESCSAELAEFCSSRAAEKRAGTLEALGTKRVRTQLSRAIANMKRIRWKKRISREGLEPVAARNRFDLMAEKLCGEMETLDLAHVERTHDLRKEAKRVRYCAERFKEVLGEDAAAIAKDMIAHQDGLGALCDARVNIDIINSWTADNLPDPISWELTLLRAKYETFLYQTLRDSKCNADTRCKPSYDG